MILATVLVAALVACDDSTRSGPRDTRPTAGTINLSSAVALALGEASSLNGATVSTAQLIDPRVMAVNEEGAVGPLEDDGAAFNDFRIINGRVFLTPVEPSEVHCSLVEAFDDGTTVCVDPYLYEFEDIQIGPDGSVYYVGSTWNDQDDWIKLLRKRTPAGENEHVFDLSGPLGVRSWAIASDGRLYLTGTTELSSATEEWIRRLNHDGSLTTISTGMRSRLMGVWPDGNLYVHDETHYGTIWQIYPEEGTLHPVPYMSDDWAYPDALYNTDELGIEGWNLDLNTERQRQGRVLLEYPSDDGLVIAELYPNPQRFESGMQQVRSGVPHGNNYYFGGRLLVDQFAIVRLNIDTGHTEVLYETALEMFALTITPDASTAMFTALDASRNQYVMATVNLATGDTTTEPVANTLIKLEAIFREE